MSIRPPVASNTSVAAKAPASSPTFSGTVTLADAVNVVAGATTGTKIATAATQKLGFYGATAIARPAAISNPSGGVVTDSEARTAIGTILTALRNLGLIAT